MWNELERSPDAAGDDEDSIDSTVAQAFFSATNRLRAFATSQASQQLGTLLGGAAAAADESAAAAAAADAPPPPSASASPDQAPVQQAPAQEASTRPPQPSPKPKAAAEKTSSTPGKRREGGTKLSTVRAKKTSPSDSAASSVSTPKQNAPTKPEVRAGGTPVASTGKAPDTGSGAPTAPTPKKKPVVRKTVKKTPSTQSTKPATRKLVAASPEPAAPSTSEQKETGTTPQKPAETKPPQQASQEGETEIEALRHEKKKIEDDRDATRERISQMQAELAQLTESRSAMTLAHENAQREHLAETQRLASILRDQEDKSSAEIQKLQKQLSNTERAKDETVQQKEDMQKKVADLSEQRQKLQKSLDALNEAREKEESEADKRMQDQLEALQEQAEKWRRAYETAREEADSAPQPTQPQSGSSTSSEWEILQAEKELLQAENEKLKRRVEKMLQSREDSLAHNLPADDVRRQSIPQSLDALVLANSPVPTAASSATTEVDPADSQTLAETADKPADENIAQIEKKLSEAAADLQSKERQIHDLQQQLEKAQADNEQLSKATEESKADSEARLVQERKELADEAAQTAAQLEEEKAVRLELETKLANVQTELQSQLEQAKAERSSVEAQLQSVQKDFEDRLGSERAQRAELDSQLEKLQAELQYQRSEADTSIQSLNEQSSVTTQKIADLEAALTQADTEKEELQKEAKKLKRSVQNIEKRSKEYQRAKEQLEDHSADLEDQLEKLREELVDRQRTARDAKKKLESQEPVVEELTQQIENLNKEKQVLQQQHQAELDEKDKSIEQLRDRVGTAESVAAKDSQTARDELNERKEELKEAQKLIELEKTKVKELVEKQEGFEAKIRTLEAQHLSLIQDKTVEVEELTNRIAQGQADLASARESEQIAQGRATSLEEEIRAYKLRAGLLLRKKEEELVQAIGSDEDNAQLVASVKELTERVETLTTERDYLQERLRESTERMRSVDDIVAMQEAKILTVEERAKDLERTREEEVSALRITVADLQSQLVDATEEKQKLTLDLEQAQQLRESMSGLRAGDNQSEARGENEGTEQSEREIELQAALEEARKEQSDVAKELTDVRDTADKLLLAKDAEVARLLAENATLKNAQGTSVAASREASQPVQGVLLPNVASPTVASASLSATKAEGSWKISRFRLILMFYVGLLHLFMAFLLFSSNSSSNPSTYPTPASTLGTASNTASLDQMSLVDASGGDSGVSLSSSSSESPVPTASVGLVSWILNRFRHTVVN